MAEDVQLLRARLMKKEKLIKDIMRADARPSYQFVSMVRKEYEKEKNVMAAKLYFLYKIAHAFAPGAAARPSADIPTYDGHLQKIIEDQLKYVGAWMERIEQKSKSQPKPAAPGGAMIKDIIQQYIETKELLKQKIRTFVLTRRSGMVQSRLDETVRQMKADGGVERHAGGLSVEEFLKKQEGAIVVELVLDEMSEKTSKLDKAVNRIVEWRAKNAAPPATSSDADRREQEMQNLVRVLVDEIDKLKSQEKLGTDPESGILNSADGRAELGRLKSNLAEQKIHASVLHDCVAAAQKSGQDGNPALRPEEIQENREAALNTCDKLEASIKDERNFYLNLRKWETTPGQFQEEIALIAQIAS